MCSSTYITGWIVELSDLENDRLSLQDIKHVVELPLAVVDVEVNEHLFCSAQQ